MLLIVNPGSSSLKVALYDDAGVDVIGSVSVEGIGSAKATLLPGGVFDEQALQHIAAPNHTAAAETALEWLTSALPAFTVDAIGYRVVHGGDRFREPALVDDEAVEYLRSIVALAPNHMPCAVDCITAFRSIYPNASHVACFDTSFFAGLPELARTLPIPKAIAAEGVRRYGFHGLSYQYLLGNFRENEGEEAARGRIVMAHLGSGCSLTACKDGQPIDTTMGFTPVSGIPMSTRTGDLEPGVLLYLQREKGMSVDEVATLITSQSGLLGISDDTADMYYLLQHQAENPSSALAVEYFCYAIRKQIGAYAAAMSGIDSIIFAGGIGERSTEIRARVLDQLGFLGITINAESNQRSDRLISTPESSVGVHVIPTREEQMIVTQTITMHKGKNS